MAKYEFLTKLRPVLLQNDIKNIGIIDDITIDLNEGFNVLTGETGAGKSLIIESLQIIAGGRFSKEIIRQGEKYAFVEMSLYIPEQGFADDMAIVSRELNVNGKNTCKINGRLVRMRFAENCPSADDCLTNMLQNLYR